MQEQLTAALQAMPHQFTSNQFCDKVRELGFTEKNFQRATSQVLLNNCKQISVKTWEKKEVPQLQQQQIFDLNEENAVKLLKGLGYKLLKMVEV